MDSYIGYNTNLKVVKESSSGGIFYALAESILNSGGVVFGAAWNDHWDVDIISVENIADISNIMKSKYVLANVGNTFEECKKFLDEGRKVLYSALPCQIHGLKRYLKKDYENLVCVDICCHGTMPVEIWHNYLASISRNCPIRNINMRDKKDSWKDFSITIEWEDGYVLSENKYTNKYFQAFISDKYLRDCCYDCAFKNKYSVADLTIGDCWASNEDVADVPCKESGLSSIVSRTPKGDNFLKTAQNLNLFEKPVELVGKNNAGFCNHIDSRLKDKNSADLFNNRRVGIVTLHLHTNFGGVLQNYALQRTVQKMGYECYTVDLLNLYKPWDKTLEFTKEHIKTIPYKTAEDIKSSDFNKFIVGSDQVWQFKWIPASVSFLEFTQDWDVERVIYGASCGETMFKYDKATADVISTMLPKFKAISARESELAKNFSDTFKYRSIPTVCDPALFLNAEEYKSLCKEVPRINKTIGGYILDKESNFSSIYKALNTSPDYLYRPQDIYQFLAMYRDCNLIVTDSYHGCIFALIFNKPFICVRNQNRGGERFDELKRRFGLYNYIMTPNTKFMLGGALNPPNADLEKFIEKSKKFLESALK